MSKILKLSQTVFFQLAFFASTVNAASLLDTSAKDKITGGAKAAGEKTFNINMTIGDVIAQVVKGFLSLLAIIFVILIIMAGYQWMSAQGEEDKVKKAQATIQRAIIGLAIILAAYAITYFVFKRLDMGTGTGGWPTGVR